MRKFLRKWLGIRALELQLQELQEETALRADALQMQVDVLSNVTKALALPAPEASVSKQEDAVADDSLPMEVEAAVGRWWFDQPQAAQATRTYARGLMSRGMHPEQIARRIAENGVVIE